MIKEIDRLLCIDCGLCEYVCPTDVLRFTDGKVHIVYPDDCCNCMECIFICPTDAVILTPEVPQKFNARLRWKQIKEALTPRG
jgi:NAD-dependent dihydropyrimidine dehydrogenase PreA subunit